MVIRDARLDVEDPKIDRQPFLPRPRRRRVVALGVAVAVLIAFGGFYVIGKRATPVTVGQAVQRYRAGSLSGTTSTTAGAASRTSSSVAAASTSHQALVAGASSKRSSTPGRHVAAPIAPVVPGPGVYVYDTKGSEHVSALGGASHTYPSQTTITVTKTPCGDDLRWDALQQRWDKLVACADGRAIHIAEIVTYHEFFKQADLKDYRCDGATLFKPNSDNAGTTLSGNCAGSGASITWKGHVVGTEDVAVAGQRTVRAVHVRMDEVLTGDTHGTRHTDTWYAVDNNLLVRREAYTDVDSKSSFGYTHYNETLSLKIASLTPKR